MGSVEGSRSPPSNGHSEKQACPGPALTHLGHLVAVEAQREAGAVVVQVPGAWHTGGAGQQGLLGAALPPGRAGRLQTLSRGPLPTLLARGALGIQRVGPAGQQARLPSAPHLGRAQQMRTHRSHIGRQTDRQARGQHVPGPCSPTTQGSGAEPSTSKDPPGRDGRGRGQQQAGLGLLEPAQHWTQFLQLHSEERGLVVPGGPPSWTSSRGVDLVRSPPPPGSCSWVSQGIGVTDKGRSPWAPGRQTRAGQGGSLGGRGPWHLAAIPAAIQAAAAVAVLHPGAPVREGHPLGPAGPAQHDHCGERRRVGGGTDPGNQVLSWLLLGTAPTPSMLPAYPPGTAGQRGPAGSCSGSR